MGKVPFYKIRFQPNLESIQSRLFNASPGNWFAEEMPLRWFDKLLGAWSKHFLWVGSGYTTFCMLSTDSNAKNDLDFIAHAKGDIESLLGEVEYLNTARKGQQIINENLRENLAKVEEEVKRLREAIENHRRVFEFGEELYPDFRDCHEELWKVLNA